MTTGKRANGQVVAPPQLTSDERSSTPLTVAEAIAHLFQKLGISAAFGVSGGAMASLWEALSAQLQVLHFRHESGAVFAATEAYFATDTPVVVFTTTGPGLTNALTGLLAAKAEGAKVILLSAHTSTAFLGRGAVQETSRYTLPGALFERGALLDEALIVEHPEQLPQLAQRLAYGLTKPGGFIAHLSIPTAIQSATFSASFPRFPRFEPQLTPNLDTLNHCIELLTEDTFAIWIGYGARHAASEVRQLAELTGAAVLCSPRAKGIFPETHPQFVGVTGMGGHAATVDYMTTQPPHRILVVGTRLGEPTSFFDPVFIPKGGFVHLDLDAAVPGLAYPTAQTYTIQADASVFLRHLVNSWPSTYARQTPKLKPSVDGSPSNGSPNSTSTLIRPAVLIQMIQQEIVDSSSAIVFAESGNAFTWATHYLQFSAPGRYRVSTAMGAMGHAVTGVTGAAWATGQKAVALVGDGAMLMQSEINTAAKYGIPAVWIVLNDGRYNMCHQGMASLGLQGADALFPPVDFALMARAMAADGIRVTREADLTAALREAIAAPGPFVVDVLIDPDELAPAIGRNRGLKAQLSQSQPSPTVSFPIPENSESRS